MKFYADLQKYGADQVGAVNLLLVQAYTVKGSRFIT